MVGGASLLGYCRDEAQAQVLTKDTPLRWTTGMPFIRSDVFAANEIQYGKSCLTPYFLMDPEELQGLGNLAFNYP